MIRNVTVGSDAEVFLRTASGQPIPVCGMVHGTKEKPRPIPELGDGFFVQEDNAALEYNVPATNKKANWTTNFLLAQRAVEHLLPASVYADYSLSSCVFNHKYLSIPAMQVFGCEPDFNAYTKTTNDRPDPPVPGFRSAAAHVHLGWTDPTDEERLELVKLCDVFCVLETIPYQNKTEADRRKLYGKAGAFRWKPYGIEHRVLGNTWQSNPGIVWDNYGRAIKAYNKGLRVDPKDYNLIQTAINEGHPKLALSLEGKYWNKLEEMTR